MNHFKKWTALAVFAIALSATSCTESEADPKEEAEITTMDSTSKVVKENKEKLEDQTKKVEQSLEKLDNEFPDTTN
jgi:hypothetical protein